MLGTAQLITTVPVYTRNINYWKELLGNRHFILFVGIQGESRKKLILALKIENR